MTGFPPGELTGTLHVGDDVAITAQADLSAAYAQGQLLTPTVNEAGLTTLDGLTLGPGIYKFDLAVTLAGNLTLSGAGDYVFQLASTLTTASLSQVIVADGASACDVYWIVSTGATLGTDSIFAGSILAGTAITVTTGTSIAGGLYGGSAVTLDTNVIGACDGAGTGTSTSTSTSSAASSTSVATSSTTPVTTPTVTSTTSVGSTTITTTSKTSTTTKHSTTTKPSTTLKVRTLLFDLLNVGIQYANHSTRLPPLPLPKRQLQLPNLATRNALTLLKTRLPGFCVFSTHKEVGLAFSHDACGKLC